MIKCLFISYLGFKNKVNVYVFDFVLRLLVEFSNKVSKLLIKDNSWLVREKLLLVKDRL